MVLYPGRGQVNAMLSFVGTVGEASECVRIVCRSGSRQVDLEHGRAADVDGFIDAVFSKMECPFKHLLDRLNPSPNAIIADNYLPWVAVSDQRGILVY
ncbi:hypothetical protein QJS10_CPB11g00892 [Acorus calamus]|uniref:Uncharacterized protein n=1 Tax=Acorus calamus TaxID=4465 RepID=A0AAV9DTB7_ACOCL|nr:hypothetical protein QJS10_CPB11g00892 [Acorus calamus]